MDIAVATAPATLSAKPFSRSAMRASETSAERRNSWSSSLSTAARARRPRVRDNDEASEQSCLFYAILKSTPP
jgi:hypothetical protein